MNYEPYILIITEHDTRFSFQSVGKNGTFEKVISFSPMDENLFNLSLVDYDPTTGKESDKSVTDNGDLDEIISTVMTAIRMFLDKHPDKGICFTGSTENRTRLFQIFINKVYSGLRHEFRILGELNQYWHEFEVNVPFENFIIAKNELDLVWQVRRFIRKQ